MYNISANTIFPGKTLIYLPTCHSTNEYAIELVSTQNPIEGTIIITPEQTKGKGQFGTNWESEPGQNLTFSILFKPINLSIQDQFQLTIISALAVRTTVSYFLNTEIKVKWPNDIYLNDNKIAGILIQNTVKGSTITNSIMGIGLNVNQVQFSDKKAISMNVYANNQFSLEEVLKKLIETIDYYYLKFSKGEFSLLLAEYTNHLFRLNVKNAFKAENKTFEGKIVGIEKDGKLVIQTEKGLESFNTKEVEFLFCN